MCKYLYKESDRHRVPRLFSFVSEDNHTKGQEISGYINKKGRIKRPFLFNEFLVSSHQTKVWS